MASWFRAAEELFEVVDRRAKQVTDDLLIGGQNSATDLSVFGRVLVTSPATKGQGVSGKSAADSTLPSDGSSTNVGLPNTPDASTVPKVAIYNTKLSTDGKPMDCQEQPETKFQKETSFMPFDDATESGNINKAEGKQNAWPGVLEDHASNVTVLELAAEPVECKLLSEDGRVSVQLITNSVQMHENAITQQANASFVDNGGGPVDKALDSFAVSADDCSTKEVRKTNDKPKLDEQLDEAQHVLKDATLSGQSKEARLARVCANLSSRLQEYKSENTQLEALLHNEIEENSHLRVKSKDVQLELAAARTAVTMVESEMSGALTSKNMEIESLLASLETVKKQAALSEGKLATLQADMDLMARSRDATENGMIQMLKDALEAAETRAEEEHSSHLATRKAAAQRETELEQYVADVTASLTRMQRTVDERTQKAAELEQKLLTLELDCASLNQDLQNAESKLRKEQKRLLEDSNQTSQIQVWREDAERARQSVREMESKNFSVEAENQKLRVEVAALKREGEQFSSEAQMELEKRFQELTEVLYLKQTQIEEMASAKAAAVLQLEKELRRSREAQAEAEQSRNVRHSITVWDDESEMKTLESLGLQQRRLVGSSIQKAAKFLDTGAVTAGRFLWQRPLARLGVLFYLLFVHAFLLYLMHRLQEQVLFSQKSMERQMQS